MDTLLLLNEDQLKLYRDDVRNAFPEYPFTNSFVAQMTNVRAAGYQSLSLANEIACSGYKAGHSEQRINAAHYHKALDTMDRIASTIKYSSAVA